MPWYSHPDIVAPCRSRQKVRRAGMVLIALAGLLYFFTLDTGLQPHELHGGDLITHQYAQVQARPSNAPGYPLYTMGGWLWFHSGRTVAGLFLAPPRPILSPFSAATVPFGH